MVDPIGDEEVQLNADGMVENVTADLVQGNVEEKE